MQLRDGTKIYTDIFRPTGEEKVPSIIGWSPYGKDFHGMPVADVTLSELQKFEAPDPAYWVQYGYAVLNPDIRGIKNSEGDFIHWSSQMGRDGYDFVQWIPSLSWSNGKVAFAGNSYLAISQWFIAAEQPSALAAIAPWEGFSDVFHHSLCAGGIPDTEMEKIVSGLYQGRGKKEDMVAMLKKDALFTGYWKDKIADVSKITVPAYVVASYTSKVHTRGTLETFIKLGSKEKWLRVHNTHEWQNFYKHQDDLRKFFDHYLKNIDNDWETTPRVRLSVLNPGGTDIVDRPEDTYPLERTISKTVYLDAKTATMSDVPITEEATSAYISDDQKGHTEFTYTFEDDTEIVGDIKIRLWVENTETNDMDLFIMAKKLSADGTELPLMVTGAPYCKNGQPAPFEWGNGRRRVSTNEDDTKNYFFKPGEVVPADITLCPMGMHFDKGQKIQISIMGYNPAKVELPIMKTIKTINKGQHILHTGGKYNWKYNESMELPVTGVQE